MNTEAHFVRFFFYVDKSIVVHKYAKHAREAVNIEQKRREKFDGNPHFFRQKANEKHIG